MNLQELAKKIDHTLLTPAATFAELQKEVQVALKYNVASICVKPYWVKETAALLKGSDVITCCVIGFPHGNSATKVKSFEAETACQDGAEEVDMVINIGKVLEEDWVYIENELKEVVKVTKKYGAGLKVIFETDYLPEDRHKIKLCELCSKLQIEFVKTSTGFGFKKDKSGNLYYDGATEHDIKLMKKHCTGITQIKASGAIRDLDKLLKMLEYGATRIGATATEAMLEEAKARAEGKTNKVVASTSGY